MPPLCRVIIYYDFQYCDNIANTVKIVRFIAQKNTSYVHNYFSIFLIWLLYIYTHYNNNVTVIFGAELALKYHASHM